MSSEQSTEGGAQARNISADEIQREMATLRSLRRRSASSGGPGALPLDPDLPPPSGMVVHATSPPKSGTGPFVHQHQHYHLHDDPVQLGREYSATSPTSPISPSKTGAGARSYEYNKTYDREREFDRFPQSHELDPDKPIMAQGEARLAGILPSAPSDDPRHLYWVPAHLHPELAPTEFRAFLKAHTHADAEGAGEGQDGVDAGEGFAHRGALGVQGAGLARSPSWLARAGANGTGMVAELARRASSHREDSQRPSPSGLATPASAPSGQLPSLGASGSLSRKRSMLSRQYHPRANDNVENEPPPLPTHREGLTRSLSRSAGHGEGIYGGAMGEQNVTLEDLQKLESIADEAAETGDPAVMRTLLKRSLSLNFSQEFVEGHPEVARTIDEQDSPILLSQQGSIMRRNAGTRRIRDRNSGVGSRLASSRRSKARGSTESEDVMPPSPGGSSHISFAGSSAMDGRSLAPPVSPTLDQGGLGGTRRRPSNSSETSDEMYSAESGSPVGYAGASASDDRRPSDASTEESSIYDAYATTDTQADTSVESSISSTSYGVDSSSEDYYRPGGNKREDQFPEEQTYQQQNTGNGKLEHAYGPYEPEQWETEGERTPTSQVSEDFARFKMFGDTTPQQQQQQLPRPLDMPRSTGAPPSPPETVKSQIHAASEKVSPPMPHPPAQMPAVAQQPLVQPRPAAKTEMAPPALKLLKTKPSIEKLKIKSEKKGGLFSKNKDKDKSKKSEKKEEKEKGFLGSLFGSKKKHEDNTPSTFSKEGKATAAALLGTSKSAKSLGLIPMQGGSPTAPGFAPYARYPIHVERAVYRLSHIKLANPRRPLYEQVLISNLMFWYLSIINKPATPVSVPTQQKDVLAVQVAPETENPPAAGARPPVTRNAPSSTPPANTKAPAPPPANEASAKRTSLSKSEQRGQSRPRSAETPIRSPQYGMQNLQMEQEYSSRPPPNQRPPPVQQAAPVNAPQQQPPQAPPSVRRAPPPHPINTNVGSGPVKQNPLSPRNVQLPYDHEPTLQVADRPRRTSSNAPPTMENGRRSYTERPQQPGENVSQSQLPYQQAPERREAPRPRQAYPQHSGPQPGQVFQYPSSMLNVKPGQVFPSGATSPGGIQPGQVFQHPQYNSISSHYSPQSYEHGEARLPPGAINPRQSSPDPSRSAQMHGQVGPRGGNAPSNGRRAASNGDSYPPEYPNSQSGGGNRSLSASGNIQYDPRAQQGRLGTPQMTMRTPSPQPPLANNDSGYPYRQPIPGHYESRR
ncbi:hypothetical protein NCC49_005572 [Naganishia albida]|nr:hypothetical protein NCC49_005572 [Naganishia albida]